MKKTKERGITLIVLVVTIIILLILMGVVVKVTSNSIDFADYNKFENELETIQEKVNEKYEKNLDNLDDVDIGIAYTGISAELKKMIEKDEVSEITNIIYKDVKNENDIKDIKESFRYVTSDRMASDLNLDSADRDYLISFKYRYVIATECYTYKNVNYYMIQQFETGTYNIQYKHNPTSGSFDVTYSVAKDNRWKINITVNYDGQIDNWTIKYKKENSNFWQTSDTLNFFINEEGTYLIEVVHGDEVNLGQKTLELSNS